MSHPGTPVSLAEIQRAARAYGCEVVTAEFLRDVRSQTTRCYKAEQLLRDVAALRIVLERKGWRGWLARRWVRRIDQALGYLRLPS